MPPRTGTAAKSAAATTSPPDSDPKAEVNESTTVAQNSELEKEQPVGPPASSLPDEGPTLDSGKDELDDILPEGPTLLEGVVISMDEAQTQLEEAERQIAKALALKAEATRKMDEAITTLEANSFPGHVQNQNNIIQYLESQKLLRAQRAATARALLKGIDPNLLNPKAKIDQVMNRGSGFGVKRPVRDVPKIS